jgi:RHS repeat-associated protein
MASQRRSGTSSFFTHDLQGSTRALANSGGSITDRYNYKAFGEEMTSSGSAVNPYRFCGSAGYYRDAADRQYVRARHLDLAAARWMSRDPLGHSGRVRTLHRYWTRSVSRLFAVSHLGNAPNEYAYANNSPLNAADPSGLEVVVVEPTNCDQVCAQANRDPTLNYGQGGGVFCFGKLMCACVLSTSSTGAVPGECPGFDACVLAHEVSHFHGCTCDPRAGLQEAGEHLTPYQLHQEERKLRRGSIACLEGMMLLSSLHCQGVIVALLVILIRNVEHDCKDVP